MKACRENSVLGWLSETQARLSEIDRQRQCAEAERKSGEERAAWLASFPERNPIPIAEVDVQGGLIDYVNPSAARMFPDLRSQGLNHAWLAGLTETVRGLTDGSQKLVVREIEAGERWYRQEIYYIPETARVRIYGSDITERKRAEEAMVRRTEELAQFNAAAVGRELRMIELKQQVNELARQLGQPLPYALEFEDTETPARDPNTLAHPAMAESKSSPPMNSIESA